MQKTVVDLTTGEVTVVEMTEEEIAGLPKITPPTREEWRLTARADRRSLVLAMAAAGILDRPNAAAAARGEWPPAFASALAGLPEDLQLAAEVDWAALSVYSRANPVWALLGQMLNISPEQVDALFGYEAA